MKGFSSGGKMFGMSVFESGCSLCNGGANWCPLGPSINRLLGFLMAATSLNDWLDS